MPAIIMLKIVMSFQLPNFVKDLSARYLGRK